MTTEGNYVIRRSNDWRYVARAGGKSSYTRALRGARRYASREAAEADRCPDNERVFRIDVG